MLRSKKRIQKSLKQKIKKPNWWSKWNLYKSNNNLKQQWLNVTDKLLTIYFCSFLVILAFSETNNETQKYCN